MGTPFRGSTSSYTRQQLRARRFERLTRDVYVERAPDVGADQENSRRLRERVTAAGLVVPDGVACLFTAGLLTRLPVDDDGAVHLVRGRDASRSLRDGVVVHRYPVQADELLDLGWVLATAGPRTLADLSPCLDLERLVAVGDVVLRRYGADPVDEALSRARRRAGVSRLRRAVPLFDPGSDSPAETRARLRLHAAGFVALQHGVTVRDAAGGWLARPDLADETAKVAVQHEGKVHFDKGEAQRVRDVDRDEITRMHDWQVVVSTRYDDARPQQLIAKVTAAYRRSALLWGHSVLPSHLR